jgi:hypothetical protein
MKILMRLLISRSLFRHDFEILEEDSTSTEGFDVAFHLEMKHESYVGLVK